MYDQMLQALIALAKTIGVNAVVGSMPPDNGVAMNASGGVDSIHMDVGGTGTINILVNGKNSDQQAIITTLNNIHTLFTRRKDWPEYGVWQISSIRTVSSPRLIGREANSQWLYGSTLAIKFYEKGI